MVLGGGECWLNLSMQVLTFTSGGAFVVTGSPAVWSIQMRKLELGRVWNSAVVLKSAPTIARELS